MFLSKRKIPLYRIYWDKEDVKAVTEVIRRGSYWTTGPEVEGFEKTVAGYIGTKYGVSFNSGTSALHAILLAYGIGESGEMIVPSFTFIATVNCALFVGAKPVFADIEEKTYGLDPSVVQEMITSKTKAVMPIHYGGMPCQVGVLREIAEDHKILLIEDAAESMGSSVNGRRVGSFGNAAMFSFCGNKVITTGEGGIILTNSGEIYEKLKLIRSHGRQETEPYFTTTKTLDYVALGYNWRITSLTAALGLSQMKKLEKVVEMRRRNAEYLTSKLSKISEIKVLDSPEGYFNVFQMYTVRVNGGRKVRDSLKSHLRNRGITSKVYFEPVHLTSFYREEFGYEGGELPVTERLSGEVLTLPLYPTMTGDEMDYLVECIEEVFQE